MRHRTGFGLVPLGIVVLLFFAPLAQGQLPPRLERCLPYSTLADEIERTKAEEQLESGPASKIAIDTIGFQGPSPASRAVRKLLIDAIRHQTLHEYPNWMAELAEVSLRGTLQEHGYFRADTSVTVRTLSQNATVEHVALTVWVDSGEQYHLGAVQFRSANPDVPLVFPVQQLRDLLLLRDGDIFNVMKLRETFDSLKRLYASSGWIDFTPTPDFDIDDKAKRINLILELDQERQYRVGNVEIWGENPTAEKVVRSMFKTGEILDGYLVDRFYAGNKAILPANASPRYDVELTKDIKKGIVNIRFDFRTCPVVSE